VAVSASALPADACTRGAPVAIIDTPVDTSHPTLRGASVETRRFLDDGLVAASPDHGTAVAALLVGRPAPGSVPLAPGAALLAAEVFAMRDGKPRADAAAILASLDWALSRRARVIGMSLAGPENQLIALGVRAAARRANIIAAAGNFGPSAPPAHPGALPQVTAVGAIDARRRAWRGANRGDYVELVGPGVGVVSAAPGGGVKEWTGTSFAVPFAMAAALRARAETSGDPDAARRLLAARATDLGAPGRDPIFGYGLVQADGRRCW
jgi:subtilisin family serine protease